jgi:hypothetical protein
MSATTNGITVLAIRVNTNLDHLFEGSDYDPALCDEAYTRENYKSELQDELQALYPDADITIWDNTVASTEVSTTTSADNSRDEETRFAVLTLDQDVQNAVDDCGVAVYARGTFWVFAD